DRAPAGNHRARVSAASQLGVRTASSRDIGALPSGLRSLLRDRGPAGPNDSAWRRSCRRRPHDEWTYGRHADASLQRRHDRAGGPDYVRRGWEKATVGASQVEVTESLSGLAP